MRNALYILICVLLIACNARNDKEMMVEAAADVKEETAIPAVASETFQHETLTKLKLQELLDLQHLAQTHPEDTGIKSQLQAITQSSGYLSFTGQQKVIRVTAIETGVRVNDSVQEIRLTYTTTTAHSGLKQDTITAVITSRSLTIDGEEQIGTKVIFKD